MSIDCLPVNNLRKELMGSLRGDIFMIETFNINEPRHEISNNVVCATSKASDQPTHKRSLIKAFASHLKFWLLSYWLNTIWSF